MALAEASPFHPEDIVAALEAERAATRAMLLEEQQHAAEFAMKASFLRGQLAQLQRLLGRPPVAPQRWTSDAPTAGCTPTLGDRGDSVHEQMSPRTPQYRGTEGGCDGETSSASTEPLGSSIDHASDLIDTPRRTDLDVPQCDTSDRSLDGLLRRTRGAGARSGDEASAASSMTARSTPIVPQHFASARDFVFAVLGDVAPLEGSDSDAGGSDSDSDDWGVGLDPANAATTGTMSDPTELKRWAATVRKACAEQRQLSELYAEQRVADELHRENVEFRRSTARAAVAR